MNIKHTIVAEISRQTCGITKQDLFHLHDVVFIRIGANPILFCQLTDRVGQLPAMLHTLTQIERDNLAFKLKRHASDNTAFH